MHAGVLRPKTKSKSKCNFEHFRGKKLPKNSRTNALERKLLPKTFLWGVVWAPPGVGSQRRICYLTLNGLYLHISCQCISGPSLLLSNPRRVPQGKDKKNQKQMLAQNLTEFYLLSGSGKFLCFCDPKYKNHKRQICHTHKSEHELPQAHSRGPPVMPKRTPKQ